MGSARSWYVAALLCASCGATDLATATQPSHAGDIGSEIAVPDHLADGDELHLATHALIDHGRSLFVANWTIFEGQGRPSSNGAGDPLVDPSSPLVGPRNLNRVSGPDTSSCSHCHNTPIVGGGGDTAMGVFVAGERFDFLTFDRSDAIPLRGSLDERGVPVTFQSSSNFRKPIGMAGSGFIEMLSRQMSAALRAQAAACAVGSACPLSAKGVSFGTLVHRADGTWDSSGVIGLSAPSLGSDGTAAPSLIIRPFHQAGAAVSLREFTNTAFNRHHGIQSEERFGIGVDADGDGFTNELTRADMTAVTIFEATLPVPGQVIPSDSTTAAAIAQGDTLFDAIGCASCHTPSLPLDEHGWMYSEPNPFNPAGNLRPSDGVPAVTVNLAADNLPRPRLAPDANGVVQVRAYTDLRLHDITTGLPSCASNPQLIATGGCDGNVEPVDQNAPAGSPAFFAGNHKFITRKLWGIANQHSFGPLGQYTTMRESITLGHNGEATASRQAFQALPPDQQAAVIEFLKSLQILPPGTPCLVVDEHSSCVTPDGAANVHDDPPPPPPFGLPNVAVGAFLPRLATGIGNEAALDTHLPDGGEFMMSSAQLAQFGRQLFGARFTRSEGIGRPFTNGADVPLRDPSAPLAFPHFLDRISGPTSQTCAGCHNTPLLGGGGDIVGSVHVLGNRFDFATFDPDDHIILKGTLDERGVPATLQSISNNRRAVGMSGSGFIEMLARQITTELRAEAAGCSPGSTCALSSKGVSFGTITHLPDGTWDTSHVVGLAVPSATSSGTTAPSFIIRPFFSAGVVPSLRVFTNNAFSRLHGMQAEERFGVGVDADQDGIVNELTRADVTAVCVFQATMAVPGRIIPGDKQIRQAIADGEQLFASVGCAGCHVPALPLDNQGWIYSEPNPFNPAGNLRISDGVPSLYVDLSDPTLPSPRLSPVNGVVTVPAYTDLKLHDMTTGLPSCHSHPDLIATGQCDGNVEPLDQNAVSGTPAFFAGNGKFITRKLWGIANQEARFGHHGAFTTMREAIVDGHHGEALPSNLAFQALSDADRAAVIEFLKSLRVLPDGTPCIVVDDRGECLPADWASH
jgi:CxxC motif-containing protein (DUF1111 family)